MNKLSRRISGKWAKLFQTKRRRQHRRRLMPETLEDRRLLNVDINPAHNYLDAEDVNGDQSLTPLDALMVINDINRSHGGATGEGEDGAQNSALSTKKAFVDVNDDGSVSAVDALIVINKLMAEGEAGNVVTFSHQATDLEGNPITSAAVGQTFVLQTLGQDTRTSPQGIFAAYLDLDYDESLVTVNQRESQTLQFTETPTGGTYRLSFNGQTTDPITFADRDPSLPSPFDRDANIVAVLNAGRIEDALLALSNVNLGDIEVVPLTGGTVDGGARFNFEAKFGGQYANTDVPKLVPSDVQLTNAATNTNTPTLTVYNTSDELLIPTLAELQAEDPTVTAQDRADLVAANEVVRSFTFAFPKYSSGHSGRLSGTTNMIIDEIGAFTSNQTPGGGDPEVVVEIQVKAIAGGTATFLGNPADDAPDHDTLVFGVDNAVSIADIGFMQLDLPIFSEITAVDDTASLDENTGPIFINVLANDSIASGTGPTITNPIPTTSANGGTVAQSGNNGFNYTPATNFTGADTFNYTITNGSATASAQVTVTVNAIDDSPVISGPNSLSTDEDVSISLSGFTITDTDSTNITVNVSANGTLSQTSFSGTPSQVTTSLNGLTYTPVSNSSATDTINISASDGNSSDSHTVNITINPINDAPVNTVPGPQALFNTETLQFTGGQFSVSDVDASTLEVSLTIGQGTLQFGTAGTPSSSLTATGTISSINNQLSTLIYDPTDTFIGDDTLTMTTSDLGQSGAGGTLTDTDTVTLTVTPPQVPFAANDSFSADEGTGPFVLSPNPLDNDLRDSGATLTLTDLSPASNFGGSLNFSNGTFTYTPPSDPDFFGTETFTYTIEQDPAPSSTGHTSDSGTIVIEILPINDGPINSFGGSPISTSPTITGNEDETLSFSGSTGLTISDIDAGTGDVTVTLTVNSGTLNVSSTSGVQGNGGNQLTIDGTVSQVNNALGGLTYSPQGNFFGDDALTINTDDNGNTGASALSDNDTVNITIQPINDAPTLVVPGKQSFLTDFDNSFSSDPAPFSIDDIDAGTNDVQVDLTIGDGTLTISSTTGVTVTPNPGGSNGIRITGSVSNINNALASGVGYDSSLDGDKTLNVVVNDLGNVGGGNQLTASGSVEVEVLDFVPIDIVGQVFIDTNGDDHQDSNEPAIEGIDVVLSGTDFQGNSVNITDRTNGNGWYEFLSLRPNQPGSPYTITQSQPVFIANREGASDTMSLTIDQRGNVSISGGSSNFGERGFVPEFADIFDHFIHLQDPRYDSGILFASQGGSQAWSSTFGDRWNTTRYSNPRLAINSDGESGVLTVFDSSLGQDRTANVSTANATLTSRGKGADRIYRVIGGSELLGSAASSEGAANDAETGSVGDEIASGGSHSIFLRAVDAIMAGE